MSSHVPRPVPVALASQRVVVSYSDGEGSGGVDVAVWHPELACPRAAFFKVPRVLRRLWACQKERGFQDDDGRDIFEIEAIGPLILLDLWPELFQDMLWAHFIDNAAAQAALIRGSSSVRSGDVLISFTWSHVVSLRALPWFERVASASNPVDGLSRGRQAGPWMEVEIARMPRGLIRAVVAELRALGLPWR